MTGTFAPQHQARFGAAGILRSEPARRALSLAIGAGVVVCGFDPFNHAADVLDASTRPWVVIALPVTAVAVAAVIGMLLFPAPARRVPRDLALGAVLLVAASLLSVAGTATPRAGALTAFGAVTVPVLLGLVVSHSRLSPGWTLGGFLAATTVLLVRADLTFLADRGLPTPGTLQAAKYENVPGDFHYLTLGNPDHTAGWLLMPLTLALFWGAGRTGRARVALLVVGAVALGTTVLTYARFALATDVSIVAAVLLAVPLAPRLRLALLGVLGAAVALMVANAFDYVSLLFSTSSDGTVAERLRSIGDGLAAMADHPVTGLGFGRYTNANGYFPAHSSIVQAGVEMGLVGFAALTALTVGAVRWAVTQVRRAGPFEVRAAAALAVGVYAVHAALAASSTSGLFSGDIVIWAMTVALFLGLSLQEG